MIDFLINIVKTVIIAVLNDNFKFSALRDTKYELSKSPFLTTSLHAYKIHIFLRNERLYNQQHDAHYKERLILRKWISC